MLPKNRRQYNKKLIVNSFGAKCQICGYNKCLAALVFHHLDPSQKEFNISKVAGNSKMTFDAAMEISKCILLCANCHQEVHAGLHPNIENEIAPPDLEEFLG